MTTIDNAEKCTYGLKNLPHGVVLASEHNQEDAQALKWSGCYPIPQIGDAVHIRFNELGSGVVESYFVEHNYVGVCVRLDSPPAWKVAHHAGTPHENTALVFGQEIKTA